HLEWLGRLGRLVGEGVAWGLTVSPSPAPKKPAVVVEPGLAVNALGQTLRLAERFELSIERPDGQGDAAPPPPANDFGDCQPSQTGVYLAGDGMYLLTIAPAGAAEGSVPTSGLGNLAASCATRFLVDAVKFRLVSLTGFFTNAELVGPKLRNLAAARCFGLDAAAALVTDPFGPAPAPARLLEKLGKKLHAGEVPLATLHWTAEAGIDFVDLWSVRRRPAGPPDELVWSPALGARAVAEAEAMMLQFQDHLDALADGPDPIEATVATAAFDYLPPAGILPLAGSPTFRGLDVGVFFQGLKARDPIFIEGARVEPLLRRALHFPPIDLASGKMIWVYHVRENAMRA
ncbi:MAG TPA: hypothetical protein VFS00_02405, partial [Polyangiaceae bacterium]|nr:hypothetical protein [Polyangiaceae bacterium]